MRGGTPEDRAARHAVRRKAGAELRAHLAHLHSYADVSDERFAGALHISRQTLWRWLRGSHTARGMGNIRDLRQDVASMFRVLYRARWHDTRPAAGPHREIAFEELLSREGWRPSWRSPRLRRETKRGERTALAKGAATEAALAG